MTMCDCDDIDMDKFKKLLASARTPAEMRAHLEALSDFELARRLDAEVVTAMLDSVPKLLVEEAARRLREND